MNSRNGRSLLTLGLFATLLVGACKWPWQDRTPPACAITSPLDSALVSGLVRIGAEASDSSGVAKVEFYVDGSLLDVDSSAPYWADWDVRQLEHGSWHRLDCTAFDEAGNTGYSDTVAVRVIQGSQRDVFHGRFEVAANQGVYVDFTAEAGDTLAGDLRVEGGGTLGMFIWLDSQNYSRFRSNESYEAVFERTRVSELSVREGAPKSGSFYLVFLNDTGGHITCWVRLALE